MTLGTFLREVRTKRQLSLRDVQQLAKDRRLGAELSSGYLSMLERDEVKEPSPRVLHSLAAVYEIDYIDLMRRAKYIPADSKRDSAAPAPVAFRGASQLSKEQQDRIQRMIDFELSESRRSKRQRRPKEADA